MEEQGTETGRAAVHRARDFVFTHGALWEQALFAHLFDGGSRERVLRCLALYQNADGGWGHGLEADIRTPASNAPTAEYALGVLLEFGLGEAETVARTASWCLAAQGPDGDFPVGPSFHDYPRAPWWRDVTRWAPDAITGRLQALGGAPPALLERTARWAAGGLTLAELRGLDESSWRYRLYHYAEYVLRVDTPDEGEWRRAVVDKTVELAREQPDAEAVLGFAWGPALPAGAVPADLRERRLGALASGQAEDGGWPDPHDLLHWRPIRTIWALETLRKAGRLAPG